jgi:hypothetical protein
MKLSSPAPAQVPCIVSVWRTALVWLMRSADSFIQSQDRLCVIHGQTAGKSRVLLPAPWFPLAIVTIPALRFHHFRKRDTSILGTLWAAGKNHCLRAYSGTQIISTVKGKALPLQAWTGLQGG